MTSLPTLVVVSGPPGSGETTLAHRLARAVGCPAISRDEIKEGMAHATPGFAPTPGDELRLRTLPVFFGVLELLLRSGVTVVAEAAFQDRVWRPRLEPLRSLALFRVVHCTVAAEVAARRTLQRRQDDPLRRAHADLGPREAPEDAGSHGAFARISVDAPRIEVDTTDCYRPGLEEIVTFVNGPGLNEVELPTSSLSGSSRASDVLRLGVELPLPSASVHRRPLAVAAIVTHLVTGPPQAAVPCRPGWTAQREPCHAANVDRASRQERTAQWMRRYQALPVQQRGIIMLGLLANSLVGALSYVALNVALIRSARRIWRVRQLGLVRAARAGLDPVLVGSLAAYAVWRIASTWMSRAVDDGRGQLWLERADRWVTERAHVARPAHQDEAES